MTKQYWLWVSLTGLMVAMIVATLVLSKPEGNRVLAQETGPVEVEKVDNHEAMIKLSQEQGGNNTPVQSQAAARPANLFGSQSDNSGVEVVPSAAFRYDGDNANSWFHLFAGGYLQNTSGTQPCFMAPTYPPAGSTLTAFSATILDDYAPENLQVQLRRAALANPSPTSAELLAEVFVSRDNATPDEFFDSTITPGKAVVSHAYSYYVVFCFPPNSGAEMRFYGANLFYTPVP